MSYPDNVSERANETDEATSRVEEAGEAPEPDAPTAVTENAGMNTILDADSILGLQNNASEE